MPTIEMRLPWPLLDAQATVTGQVIWVLDLTERRKVEVSLRHRALHDPLTGLPNRALLQERITARAGEAVAVLFVDLDRFKLINDGMGHDAGDRVLAAVAQRLSGCVRVEDIVARFGGDEFVVVLQGPSAGEAHAVADRLLAALHQPFACDDREIVVGASIGIAVSDDPDVRLADLLRDADAAMYRAKALGKATAVEFDASMLVDALRQLDQAAALSHAIERDALRLHFQPIVDLASGQIAAFEALLRWQHPSDGLLPPDAFLPVAEEMGLVGDIGQWVLTESCRWAEGWSVAGGAGLPGINVNISARQFHHGGGLDHQVEMALRESGLSPHRLQLEVTERALLDDADAALLLATIRGRGVRLARDDFGTGYSALGYLPRLPVDALKIDRSIVIGLGRDSASLSVARAVATVAHDLGLDVTAEGIETEAQLAYARVIGCHHGQGFLFDRPLPAERANQLAVASGYRLGPTPGRVDSHVPLLDLAQRADELCRGSSS